MIVDLTALIVSLSKLLDYVVTEMDKQWVGVPTNTL